MPLIIFIGDGVSDLAAAREADVLFARKGLRLEEYCIENKIPYIGFDSFSDIKRDVESIMKEDQQKTGGVGKPARFNPRANMWRRISSKQAVGLCSAIAHQAHANCSRSQNSLLLLPQERRRCFCGPKAFRNTNLGPMNRIPCIC
jgi:hypothetical protein